MGYDMTSDTISLYLYGSVIFGLWSCFILLIGTTSLGLELLITNMATEIHALAIDTMVSFRRQ